MMLSSSSPPPLFYIFCASLFSSFLFVFPSHHSFFFSVFTFPFLVTFILLCCCDAPCWSEWCSAVLCLQRAVHGSSADPPLLFLLFLLCRIFNISNGKQKKLYKGSQGEDGTLIKVSLV